MSVSARSAAAEERSVNCSTMGEPQPPAARPCRTPARDAPTLGDLRPSWGTPWGTRGASGAAGRRGGGGPGARRPGGGEAAAVTV